MMRSCFSGSSRRSTAARTCYITRLTKAKVCQTIAPTPLLSLHVRMVLLCWEERRVAPAVVVPRCRLRRLISTHRCEPQKCR